MTNSQITGVERRSFTHFVRKYAVNALRGFALFAAMVLSFTIAASLTVQRTSSATTPPLVDAAQAGVALLIVSAVNALILSWPIARARWHGLKLIAAISFVFFGVQTFMSQIETVFFGSAFAIPFEEMVNIVLSGLLTALLFTPLAVLILGKMRTHDQPNKAEASWRPSWRWVGRMAWLPLVYIVLYFVFGYFIAWQSADVRLLYSGSTQIEPFHVHLLGVFRDTPSLLLFQYLRGWMWIGLAIPIVSLMRGSKLEKALAVGVLFGLLLTTQLLFPNPYMAAPVRMAHFVETSTSTFLYGWLIGLYLTREGSAHSAGMLSADDGCR